MNPLEDAIVAMRPILPVDLPFKVGDSVRYLDPTQPPGVTSGFAQIDPYTGNPQVVTNVPYNFHWEYVWHCHMLGHEDFDMMRPLVILAAPAAPSGLTATPDPGSTTVPPGITLRWTNNAVSPPATSVVIQRATDEAFTTGLTTITLPASTTTYTDRTVVPGTTYYYRVRAENSAAYSAWSNTASASVSLLAPTGLTAIARTDAPLRISLVWTLRSYATGMVIQRATNAAFTQNVQTWTSPVLTGYTDTTVTAGTTYYYRVASTYLGQQSPWSNTASATALGAPPTPTNLAASAVVSGSGAVVTLTWSEAAGATVTGFVIQRATNSTFTSGLNSFNVPGNLRTFQNTVARFTTYWYRIQAVNLAGSSPFSAGVRITTP